MIDRFAELIQELSDFLQMPLYVDRKNACVLKAHGKTEVQLQLDHSQEKLLMGCLAIELPPGKFRENVLKEGLKTNNLPDPRPAICSYISQNNYLFLHQAFPLIILNGERLAGYFGAFLTEAESWVKAIESGQPSPNPIAPDHSSGRPFGIKP